MNERLAQRAGFDGIEIEYELRGTGEPVVLIPPGHFADWFVPLLDEPVLVENHRVLAYHRVGSAGSSRTAGPVSLAQHASHCRGLMRQLGIERAHVVGHSSSGNVALQFALEFPDAVRTLAILEPALMSVPSAESSRAFVGKAVGLYREGKAADAIDTFLRGVCGPNYRAVLDRGLPRAFDQHVADAATFFEQELPALAQWTFTREDAQRIRQPVLAVVGASSLALDRIWAERHELLLSWLPHAEPAVLSDTGHLMAVQNPQAVAQALAAFFTRHSSHPGA